jgi:protein-disulfide isomerase
MVFTDFQCPFCRRFAVESLAALKAEFIDAGQLRVVFRHLPLTNIHPLAERAAAVGECAQQQNQFWPYHDAIFGSAAADPPDLEALLADLENDGPLARCLNAEEWKARVAADQALAASLGIRTTPTAVLGPAQGEWLRATRVIRGAMPTSEYRDAILTLLTGT